MAEFLDACLAWQTPELVVHASLGMLIDEPFSFDLTVVRIVLTRGSHHLQAHT
jgi:hypothetical protein